MEKWEKNLNAGHVWIGGSMNRSSYFGIREAIMICCRQQYIPGIPFTRV